MSHTSVSSDIEKVEGVTTPENDDHKARMEAEKGEAVLDEAASDLPKGFALAMIVLAMVLAVFIVSLDLASITSSTSKLPKSDIF